VGSVLWTGDGEIVFGGRGAGALQRVKAAGGVPHQVTALAKGEMFHAWPSLLPDGRHFLYLIGTPATRALYVGSLDIKPDRQPRVQVAPAQFGATFVRSGNSAGGGYLFFVRDGTLMAQPFDPKAQRLIGDPIPVVQQIGVAGSHAHFSVTAGGVLAYRTGPGLKTQLTWLDRAGKLLDTAGDAGQPISIALSPDEKQVAIFRSDRPNTTAGDIWLLDLGRNKETRLTTGQTSVVSPYGPVWSPDGKQLAYASGNGIYIKDAGGATDAKLVKNLGHPASITEMTDWTRDGRFLIYDEGERGGGIRELPVGGGDPIPVVVGAATGLGRISLRSCTSATIQRSSCLAWMEQTFNETQRASR
jgi:hypothetical protein